MRKFYIVFVVAILATMMTHASPQEQTPVTFFVKKIVVTGHSGLPKSIIKQVISPYENHLNTLQTLQQLAEQLTSLEEQIGYDFLEVIVPRQVAENGVVKLEAAGKAIGNIKVTGTPSYSAPLIRARVYTGIVNGTINPDAFIKALVLLNQLQDLNVSYKFVPETDSNVYDLNVVASGPAPLDGNVNYNNYENPSTGRDTVNLSLNEGSLTGRADTLSVSTNIAFAVRTNLFTNDSYTLPIDAYGNSLTFSYSNADYIAGPVFISRGNEHVFGLMLTSPLTQTPSLQTNFTFGFNFKNGNQFVNTGLPTGTDMLRELQAGYSLDLVGNTHQTSLSFNVIQGLGTWFGGMSANDPLVSRLGASDTFTTYNATVNDTRTIFSSDQLILRGGGQLASGPLSTLEQYAVGGEDSVRGYVLSALAGENGWNASAELRFPLNKQQSVMATTFYDMGGIHILAPVLAGAAADQTLTGTGVGLLANIDSQTTAHLEIGFPLRPTQTSTGEKSQDQGSF